MAFAKQFSAIRLWFENFLTTEQSYGWSKGALVIDVVAVFNCFFIGKERISRFSEKFDFLSFTSHDIRRSI